MKYTLRDGTVTQIDEGDLPLLMAYKWEAPLRQGRRYVTRHDGRTTITLTRVMMAAPKGMFVDHINGDTLDNRRANLRLATPKQSAANKGAFRNSASRFVGVTRHKKSGKWQAHIGRGHNAKYLGLYESEVAAARAYDAAAIARYGAFAHPNFKEETP